jgi:hypothetical protein
MITSKVQGVKEIENIILSYCEGFEHLEFSGSDLIEIVEEIVEGFDETLTARLINATTDK